MVTMVVQALTSHVHAFVLWLAAFHVLACSSIAVLSESNTYTNHTEQAQNKLLGEDSFNLPSEDIPGIPKYVVRTSDPVYPVSHMHLSQLHKCLPDCLDCPILV